MARLRREGISDRIVDAMSKVPRDAFVPAEMRSEAWEDHPIPIGWGQTISQPYVVGLMTQAAAVGPGDVALDVGTGSGYQAAVLAACGARVIGIERIEELAERARATLLSVGMDVPVVCGDGADGWADAAPYDAIVVGAAAESVPAALVEQLRAPTADRRGGRLVIPVGESGWFGGQRLELIERMEQGTRRQHLLDVVFVPLITKHRRWWP